MSSSAYFHQPALVPAMVNAKAVPPPNDRPAKYGRSTPSLSRTDESHCVQSLWSLRSRLWRDFPASARMSTANTRYWALSGPMFDNQPVEHVLYAV